MSMLLVLLMAISLLPAAALAEGPNEPGANESDSLYLNKSYDPATGMLTLETYAKGETITVEKVQPCDIVLVLDVSGSMDEWIKVGSFSGSDTAQLDPVRGAEEGFYRVDTSFWFLPLGERPLRFHDGKWQYQRDIHIFTDGWTDVGSNVFGMNSVTVKRINAMKVAADRFIDTVQANAEANDVDHQISIVKFASNYTDVVGNNRISGNNYSQIVKNLTTVKTTQQASELKNSLTPIVEGGATQADFGMRHAEQILTAANNPERGKVVVFMTDGTPTDYNQFNSTVADGAVRYAKNLKDIGTLVYSVGIFDEDPGTQINRFMNAVSSNTPGATSYTQGSSSQNAGKYYMTAGTANGLEEIFKSIAEEIGGSFIDLNEHSTVVDQMSSYFKLDGVTASDISKVEVYTADCTDVVNEKPTFADPVRFAGADISVTDGDTVNVSGFDFSENWVGLDAHNNAHGKKLIIKFPVQPKEGAEGMVPTNSSASGVYDENGKPVQEYPVPQYEVGAFTKVIDFNGKMILARDADAPLYATSNNGEFGMDGTSAYYQLRNDGLKASSKDAPAVLNSDYSGVDTAMIFGKFGTDTVKSWKNVKAIPASNIYYSDNLTEATLAVNDQIGYNEGVTYVAPTAESANKTYSFTFTGSRIDVYATTTPGTKTVTATLYQNGEKVAEKMVNTKVPTDATRVSAPSVSFDGLSGTYTLEIFANVKANFLLEAVRVYNANEANAEVEPNARYINLRDMVLDKESADELENETPDAVLFMDEVKSENPYQEGTDAYRQYIPQTYEALGPKNEVYLAPGQAIGFEVASGVDVMVSLRSPETESGTVMINGDAQAVTNVDMYYPVTLDEGVVMIRNESEDMISVINVKLTTAEADGSRMMIFSSPKLLARAAQYVAPAAAEVNDEPVIPDFSAIIRQLISDFVRTLFSSISRLFGN
jgi:uncharacterized protein YegL